jgi:hypothetical protein
MRQPGTTWSQPPLQLPKATHSAPYSSTQEVSVRSPVSSFSSFCSLRLSFLPITHKHDLSIRFVFPFPTTPGPSHPKQSSKSHKNTTRSVLVNIRVSSNPPFQPFNLSSSLFLLPSSLQIPHDSRLHTPTPRPLNNSINSTSSREELGA